MKSIYETFIFVQFQAVLHCRGDIVFAYESVPSNLAELIGGSEAGTVAVGISDAFELGGNLYGYHKADVKLGKKHQKSKHGYFYGFYNCNHSKWQYFPSHLSATIRSRSVVKFGARQTCNQLHSCTSCLTTQLSTFDCQWCPAIRHCSSGYDRMRYNCGKLRQIATFF